MVHSFSSVPLYILYEDNQYYGSLVVERSFGKGQHNIIKIYDKKDDVVTNQILNATTH